MVRATARNRRPASPRREHRRDNEPVRPPGGGIAPFVAIAVIAAGLRYVPALTQAAWKFLDLTPTLSRGQLTLPSFPPS